MPEKVFGARCAVLRGVEGELGVVLVGVVDGRSDEAEEDEEHDDEQAHYRQLVLNEDPQDLSAHAAGRRCLSSFGNGACSWNGHDVARGGRGDPAEEVVRVVRWRLFVQGHAVLPSLMRGSAMA